MFASTVSPGPAAVTRRPSTGWYWVSGLLLVAGLVAAAVWIVSAVTGVSDRVDQFPRTSVPGELSVVIDAPDTYYVYSEGAGESTLESLELTVTDPSGEPVMVRPVDSGVVYDTDGGAVGRPVGEFQASAAGAYAVTVAGESGGDQVAVGDSLTADVVPPILGAGLLLILTTGGAVAITAVTAVRRSRRSPTR